MIAGILNMSERTSSGVIVPGWLQTEDARATGILTTVAGPTDVVSVGVRNVVVDGLLMVVIVGTVDLSTLNSVVVVN